MIPLPLSSQVIFNSGGAGYVLNSAALDVLATGLKGKSCFPHQVSSSSSSSSSSSNSCCCGGGGGSSSSSSSSSSCGGGGGSVMTL